MSKVDNCSCQQELLLRYFSFFKNNLPLYFLLSSVEPIPALCLILLANPFTVHTCKINNALQRTPFSYPKLETDTIAASSLSSRWYHLGGSSLVDVGVSNDVSQFFNDNFVYFEGQATTASFPVLTAITLNFVAFLTNIFFLLPFYSYAHRAPASCGTVPYWQSISG